MSSQGSYLSKLYKQSLVLLTDLYQLTMAYGYWKLALEDRPSCFYLFFRRKPFQGSYAIASGLGMVIDFLSNFRFTDDDIAYLESLTNANNDPLFEQGFIKYLRNLEFACDVDAVEEGTPVFPYEPLIRVKGPLLQAQLLESTLLNLFNFQTLVATKSARVCRAAFPGEVIEFGVRRAQGIDGSLAATRASYIGGCHKTSNVLGGKLFGIPITGTHAHSWVMAHKSEQEAFESFAEIMPKGCVFLVDTYNTDQGTKNAIEVAKKLKKKGSGVLALRLDSGDLAKLSIKVRKMLDQEGLEDVKIMASNELDERIIRDLKHQGAKINYWGVGTNLVTAKEQPALDGVYKLCAIGDDKGDWDYKLKISESMVKITDPGLLKVVRFKQNGKYLADVIYDELLGFSSSSKIVDPLDSSRSIKIPKNATQEELLKPIFSKGKLVYKPRSLQESRKRVQEELKQLDLSVLRFLHPEPYFVGMEKRLYDKKMSMIDELNNA